MKRPIEPLRRCLGVLVFYLWSVPLVLLICARMDWQYEGDAGWWFTAAYTTPVWLLARRLASGLDTGALQTGYAAIVLMLSLVWLRCPKGTHNRHGPTK